MKAEHLRTQVADACLILAVSGHGDLTLGHVSARIPGTETIWVKGAGLGLEEVRPADVCRADLDGRKLAGRRRLHSELIIHTALYRARADVGCVIHTHPFYATAFAALDQRLSVYLQDGVFLADGVALFRDTPELLVSADHGAALARALGSATVVLLRHHGVVVVGPSVPIAVLRALALERAAKASLVLEPTGRAIAMEQHFVQHVGSGLGAYRREEELWAYLVRSSRRALRAGAQ